MLGDPGVSRGRLLPEIINSGAVAGMGKGGGTYGSLEGRAREEGR